MNNNRAVYDSMDSVEVVCRGSQIQCEGSVG